jgi:hypothetical protein
MNLQPFIDASIIFSSPVYIVTPLLLFFLSLFFRVPQVDNPFSGHIWRWVCGFESWICC